MYLRVERVVVRRASLLIAAGVEVGRQLQELLEELNDRKHVRDDGEAVAAWVEEHSEALTNTLGEAHRIGLPVPEALQQRVPEARASTPETWPVGPGR